MLKKARPAAEAKFRYVHLVDEVTDAQQKTGECQLGCLVPARRISHVEQIDEEAGKVAAEEHVLLSEAADGIDVQPAGVKQDSLATDSAIDTCR